MLYPLSYEGSEGWERACCVMTGFRGGGWVGVRRVVPGTCPEISRSVHGRLLLPAHSGSAQWPTSASTPDDGRPDGERTQGPAH
jgi:hypothetical protein